MPSAHICIYMYYFAAVVLLIPFLSSSGEISEGPREWSRASGWGFVTPQTQERPQGTSFPYVRQRPLEAYSY